MSSPSIRRDKGAKHMSAQEVAERSQRQLGVVAVIGALVPLLIVLVVLVFHFTVGSAVTGSCVIEEEKHIAHEYRMGHHREALRRLSDLILTKPMHHWSQHLDTMEDMLQRSDLLGSGAVGDAAYVQIEAALGEVVALRKDPDNEVALGRLGASVSALLAAGGSVDPGHKAKSELR
mmetsp:Transcript_9401/g.32485  ORF Transcript_9401/g.32485 Transcript_9401/m.32485 type:complete len:176 (-) Transcript_9401:125-652(-)